jgi:hypothetical protein
MWPLVVTLAVALNAVALAQTLEGRTKYRLVFPSISLDPDQWQAMDELHFTVGCGHIEGISWVPEMWNVEIVRAMSAVEEFRATAGLGAARLNAKEIQQFSGAITISASEENKNCFKLSGGITSEAGSTLKSRFLAKTCV